VGAWAQYSGPQVLSRGSDALGDRPGANSGFQYYVGAGEAYEIGILPTSVDATGKILDLGGLFSVWANLGAYGRHAWRHTTLGLDYTGEMSHYTSASQWDRSDHVVSLALSHAPTRRLRLDARVAGGAVSRYYMSSLAATTGGLAPSSLGMFDSRAYYLDTSASASYMWSPRLSFEVQGQGFAVRHRSKALIGLNGYGAQGTVAYQISRKQLIQASYRYMHADYVRGFGESDSHVYMAGYKQVVGRRWVAGVSGGVANVHAIGLEMIAADPLTQALFGTASTVQAFDHNTYVPAVEASLTGRFKNSEFVANYSQMPVAGNGIYMTSDQKSAAARYRYVFTRRASVGVTAAYSRLEGFGQTLLGTTWYTNVGADTSFKVTRSFELFARYDTRKFQMTTGNQFGRLGYIVMFGLNFHPSEIPVSIW
jgi:hypothetical protein